MELMENIKKNKDKTARSTSILCVCVILFLDGIINDINVMKGCVDKQKNTFHNIDIPTRLDKKYRNQWLIFSLLVWFGLLLFSAFQSHNNSIKLKLYLMINSITIKKKC